jgi:heat shock protein HslJ
MRTALIAAAAAAAMTLAGCADGNPVASGEDSPQLFPSARLTVSARVAGGAKSATATDLRPTMPPVTAELRFDAPTTLAGMEFEWLDISDSRCPEDVVCIWAGEVRISVRVTPASGVPEEHEMVLGSGDADAARLAIGETTIELRRVDPSPLASQPTERSHYVAELGVARRSGVATRGLTVAGAPAGSRLPGPDPMYPPKPPEPNEPVTKEPNLQDRVWILSAMGLAGSESKPLDATSVWLAFAEDGTLKGSGGCNSYSATYSLPDGSGLTVFDLGYTEMACGAPEGVLRQENTYFAALVDARTWDVQDDRLSMRYGDGGILLFTASAAVEDPKTEDPGDGTEPLVDPRDGPLPPATDPQE